MPALRSRKGQWLLALLILKRSAPLDRDWLAGTLWPDTTEENALSSLRKSLNDLRNALGVEAVRLHAPTPRTLALDLSGAFCDLTAFDACLARPQENEATLEQAIALYRGPLLQGCFEEWILLERTEREQAYLHALETLAERAMERGDSASAIERLSLCIGLDPLRESSQRRLMRAFAAEGNHAAVKKTYRDLRLYLHRELNIEPDPETTRLYEQLRRDAQNVVPRAVPSKEVRQPEERALSSFIPQSVTELVGRAREIEEIELSLTRARLVSVTGTGGVGKTRLAVEVAQRCLNRYTDGVWFVELAALTEAALVAQTVASLLGVREQPGVDAQESLLQTLRTRNLLLVLDNCEHLIQECTRLSAELLRHCPEVSVLVTSRQALGITGEIVWRVPSLSLPPPEPLPPQKDLPALLMEFDAVHLFVKRAVLVQPAFRLKPQNAPTVVKICQMLDGIPLAIELAAARLRVLTPEQIAARLEDLFRLLTGGNASALPRQQTLRSAMDWSYDLLTEEERALLRSLSVFVGGWTLDTAESVCSVAPRLQAWEILDLLASLVDKSLVTFKPGEAGEARYYLLETVRRYSLDRLAETGEAEAVYRRHRETFLALAEEAAPKMHGPEAAFWLDQIEREHDNLRAALQFCLQQKRKQEAEGGEQQEREPALRLVCAMADFWEKRCYWSEARAYLAEALEQTQGADPHLRIQALLAAGWMSRKQGDRSSAKRLNEQALLLARELQAPRQVAVAVQQLGTLALNEGSYAEGKAYLEESLALYRAREDKRGIAICLLNLATIAQPEGDYPQAHRLLEESLEVFRALGDQASVGVVLNNLGNLLYYENNYAAAKAVYEESLAIRRELGSKSGIATVLTHLGNVYNDLGDYERARQLMEESLALRRQIGEIQQIAYTLHNMGTTAYRQRDYAAAAALHRESIPLLQQVMDRPALSSALDAFAVLAVEQGQNERAIRLWAAAAALRELLGVALSPSQREERDQKMNALRLELGDASFEAQWQEGSALTLEEALAYAIT